MSGKARRYWQYRVTDVWGCMEDRIEPGDLTLDRWVGHHYTYQIFDYKLGEITGTYSVEKIAEATPEQYADLQHAGRAVPASKVATS